MQFYAIRNSCGFDIEIACVRSNWIVWKSFSTQFPQSQYTPPPKCIHKDLWSYRKIKKSKSPCWSAFFNAFKTTNKAKQKPTNNKQTQLWVCTTSWRRWMEVSRISQFSILVKQDVDDLRAYLAWVWEGSKPGNGSLKRKSTAYPQLWCIPADTNLW